jgi:hypothetical protein
MSPKFLTRVCIGSAALFALGACAAHTGAAAPGRDHPATPHPAGRPAVSAIAAGEVIKPHPFLQRWDVPPWVVRVPAASPAPLIHCVDPRTWGASASRAAAWVDPHPQRHPNYPHTHITEFLLQYPDSSSAHSALVHAALQFRHCPRLPGDVPEPPDFERNRHSEWNWDQAFFAQRALAPHGRGGVFALLVARAGNVLIVDEDTGIPSDRPEYRLTIATLRALRHHDNFRCLCFH